MDPITKDDHPGNAGDVAAVAMAVVVKCVGGNDIGVSSLIVVVKLLYLTLL